MKIMIDPGHAPGNPNHGPTGFYEYEGMWKISNFLKAALERCGFEVGLTRSEDECPELSARGESAKGCDLFFSEHSNAGGGKGCECYYSVRIPGDEGFASAFAQAVSGVLGDASRGAKTWHSTKDPNYDYLAVMWYAVYVGCPHVFLCENGFHDNAEDEAQLKSDEKLRDIAESQAKVICEHLGAVYSSEAADGKTGEDTQSETAADQLLKPRDKVKIKPGVTAFADGTGMASFIRSAVLYVRQIGDGKVLVSTVEEGAVTGWVRTSDLLSADSGESVPVSAGEKPAEAPAENFPAELKIGDKVHIRDGVTAFADGTGMASFIRTAELYVRQIGDGKVLVSTMQEGAVTGWVKTSDLVLADGKTAAAPAQSSSESPAELKVGDKVHIRDGVTTFADGVSMASFVRSASLYVRYLGVGKVLVSTEEDGPVTGWVKNEDVVKE